MPGSRSTGPCPLPSLIPPRPPHPPQLPLGLWLTPWGKLRGCPRQCVWKKGSGQDLAQEMLMPA